MFCATFFKFFFFLDFSINFNIPVSHIFSVPMKVKKTDLPILPPESEILPSLDDSEDNLSEDSEDEEIDEEEDEMMADEPIDNLEEEEDEDEYDSDEDASDFINDNGNNYNYNNWDPIINTSQIIINKDASTTNSPTTASTTTTTTSSATTTTSAAASAISQTTPQITDKPSEIPISPMSDGATAIPTPDPYFTHFDPRMEHQSYKVGLDVKTTLKITLKFFFLMHFKQKKNNFFRKFCRLKRFFLFFMSSNLVDPID